MTGPLSEAETTSTDLAGQPIFDVLAPKGQTAPMVLASPHSGTHYSESFLKQSCLDSLTIRKSEDSFVDALVVGGTDSGVPLLRAHFPRAYVDPNREPFELDPAMFRDPLPDYVNTASPRAAGGLGTIARVVCSGAEIYAAPLSFSDALQRINQYYHPYHQQLARMLDQTKARFGRALLIDCHSMPSIGGPMDRDPGDNRVDFVLGDRHGQSCAPALTDFVQAHLEHAGYVVRRNIPYAGGFTTAHYGQPDRAQHALQIEINRMLYMNEDTYQRLPEFQTLADDMRQLFAAMVGQGIESLIG